MDFRVLGPLELIAEGRNVAPTAPKPRQVVALLIMRRNAVVQTVELIDELWEDRPPTSAMTTLQTYIYKLRKVFLEHGAADLLETTPGGYMLVVPDSAVDLHHVERASSEGQASIEAGDPARARQVLSHALSIWRGPALIDVSQGARLSSYVTRLEEFRSRLLELRIEADLHLGLHRELVSELKSLVVTHPLNEHLHASLMIALYRSGRRHEALEAYRHLHRNMVDDLGLEPGQQLKQLHQALLLDAPVGPPAAQRQSVSLAHSEAVPTEPAGSATSYGSAVPGNETAVPTAPPEQAPALLAPPAQLPADIADFAGRTVAIDEMVSGLELAGSGTATLNAPRIGVITGMPGVGKTALAVRVGHHLRTHFPDGQLYADLRGSTDAPEDAADVLHGFLRALAVPDAQIPYGREERSKLFRSVTNGRRYLVVLDDAGAQVDVASLLPADARCAVVITSRCRLHGLAGAVVNLELDVLDYAESLDQLSALVGRTRLDVEPVAADELVAASGGLPLALRCIGGRLAARPGLPLARTAEQLKRARYPMDQLRLGDLDVRSRFDSSYERLGRLEQSAFRLLNMLPAPEFAADVAADLLGWDVTTVERALERLADHYLVKVLPGDDGGIRYAFPELARVYARERLASTLARSQRDEIAGDEFAAGTVVLQPALQGNR